MKKFLIFLLSVFLLSGCVKKVKDPNFTVEDSGIYDSLEVVSEAKRVKDDGFTEIEVIFKNYTDSNEKVAYKVDWFDKDGFIVDTIMSKWKVVEVEANRNMVIHAISPSVRATEYKIRMQFPSEDDEFRNNPAQFEYQGK